MHIEIKIYWKDRQEQLKFLIGWHKSRWFYYWNDSDNNGKDLGLETRLFVIHRWTMPF